MASARSIAVCVWLLLPATAWAHGEGGHRADPNLHVDASLEDCSVMFSSELTQGAFERFIREFGSVAAFKQGAPPTTLGQWGVSVGLEQIFFTVEEHADAWNDTFHHPDSYHELGSDLAFPKLKLRVGVTDEIDVGAFFTKQPKANYGWLGFDFKYGVLKQAEQMPVSLAVRGSYTMTLFIEDMDMHAVGVDVSVGRTFWEIVTPYLGLGSDIVVARESSDAVELETDGAFVPHLLAGLEARYWHVAIGAEAQLAVIPSLQLQASVVF